MSAIATFATINANHSAKVTSAQWHATVLRGLLASCLKSISAAMEVSDFAGPTVLGHLREYMRDLDGTTQAAQKAMDALKAVDRGGHHVLVTKDLADLIRLAGSVRRSLRDASYMLV